MLFLRDWNEVKETLFKIGKDSVLTSIVTCLLLTKYLFVAHTYLYVAPF